MRQLLPALQTTKGPPFCRLTCDDVATFIDTEKRWAREFYGVSEGDRTLDNWSHNPVLYRLSYTHHKSGHILAKRGTLVNGKLTGSPFFSNGAPGRTRTPGLRLRRPLLYPAELLALMVGARGFEPPAPCSQGRCATRLRYAPTSPILYQAGKIIATHYLIALQ